MIEVEQTALSPSELDAIDAWWHAANYLSVGQIYLLAGSLPQLAPGQRRSATHAGAFGPNAGRSRYGLVQE